MFEPIPAEELKKNKVCCGNGCKNCPYVPQHTKGSTVVKENFSTVLVSDFHTHAYRRCMDPRGF
jgi:hypothetical protein